jgi:hypothetical protein
MAQEHSRWDLTDDEVERHMALSYEFVMEMLGDDRPLARRLDPAGAEPLRAAKLIRREAQEAGPEHEQGRIREFADRDFGLPKKPDLTYWRQLTAPQPWKRAPGAA